MKFMRWPLMRWALGLGPAWGLGLSLFCASAWAADPLEALTSAVIRDYPSAIVTQVLRGVDPNLRDKDGQHLLHIAIRRESYKAAVALIDIPQVNVDVRNAKDETPMMLAAIRGQIDLVKKLLARDADVNKPGWTPLHYAATGGHVDIMKLFLEAHAYIDAESPNRSTPLMMAAGYGSEEAARLLIEEGADVSLRNELGLTALDFAKQSGRTGMIGLIEAAQNKQPR